MYAKVNPITGFPLTQVVRIVVSDVSTESVAVQEPTGSKVSNRVIVQQHSASPTHFYTACHYRSSTDYNYSFLLQKWSYDLNASTIRSGRN